MKAEKAFSGFYKTRADIYRIKRGSSYSDGVETELIGSVSADIQPCGADVSVKERGLTAQKSFKLYCGGCDAIREGRYVSFGGEMYRVVSVRRWEIGTEALISADDVSLREENDG